MTPATDAVREARPISEHPCHGLFVSAGDKLSHRHWFQDNQLMPTCERCGTPINREHKEVGPVSWEPEPRKKPLTLQDRYRISAAAVRALGEWLAWPDAGRDGAREVTPDQVVSWLSGLPNKLGYAQGSTITEATSQPREGGIVAWRERDGDEWVYYDAESDTGKHIAEYQRQWHNVRVFPLYALTQRPPEQAGAVPAARYLADRFKWAAPGDQQEDVWLVRFCDNDVRDAIYTGPDAESEAWAAWNRHAPGYNMFVFRLAMLTAAPTPPDAGIGSDGAGERV